tara:strand:+ start:401 stop:577 length:177 start_codon:yes stop_codon:yes gene_type:complete
LEFLPKYHQKYNNPIDATPTTTKTPKEVSSANVNCNFDSIDYDYYKNINFKNYNKLNV